MTLGMKQTPPIQRIAVLMGIMILTFMVLAYLISQYIMQEADNTVNPQMDFYLTLVFFLFFVLLAVLSIRDKGKLN